MASRIGTYLADKNKCRDFSELPMGMALADNIGGFSNPFFKGIKPSRYPQGITRPSSVDVLATNLGKFMHKNPSLMATKILEEYTRQAREFKPTVVSKADIEKMDNPRGLFTMEDFEIIPSESVQEKATEFYRAGRSFSNLGDILTYSVKGSQSPALISPSTIYTQTSGMNRARLINLANFIYNESGIAGPGISLTKSNSSMEQARMNISSYLNRAQQLQGVPIDPLNLIHRYNCGAAYGNGYHSMEASTSYTPFEGVTEEEDTEES